MFDALEWLQSVEDAARMAAAELRWIDAAGMLSMRSGNPMSRIHTGASDPMGHVDAMIDAEPAHRRALAEASAAMDDARAVFSGMRSIGPMECDAASMMELVHIGLSTKKDAAAALGLPYSAGKSAYRYGVDWLDSHGLACAKAGRGLAE